MPENPLKKADRTAARKALFELGHAKDSVKLAKSAGLDVAEQEARVMHLDGLLKQMLATYDHDVLKVPDGD